MATIGNRIMQKLCNKYCCEKCDYNTVRKSSYDAHLLSAKHQNATNGNGLCNPQKCDVCNKCYKDRTGLWRHKKKCVDVEPQLTQTDLIMDVLQQNKVLNKLLIEQNRVNAELHAKVLELCKNGIIGNTTNNTNSHNKTFNLQIYLNETCKDAINLEDFAKSVILQLSDLDRIGEAGFVDGMTNIIESKLSLLDEHKRPIHCTDAKREIIYVKDNDKWEKDEGKKKMRRLIQRMDRKLAPLLIVFGQNHKNLGYSTDSEIIKHQSIVYEILGGKDDDVKNEDAIIRRLSRKTIIEKEDFVRI